MPCTSRYHGCQPHEYELFYARMYESFNYINMTAWSKIILFCTCNPTWNLIQRHHQKLSCCFRGKNPDVNLLTWYIVHNSFTLCSVCWCSPMPHQLLCEVSAICPQRSYEAAVNHVTTYSDAWWRSVVGLLYPCASTQLPLASLCHPSDHDLGLIFFLHLFVVSRSFQVFLASLVSCSEQVSNFTNLTIVPLLPCFEAATPILFGASPPASLSSSPGWNNSVI